MSRHDAIFFEEPPAAGFKKMLAGDLKLDEYMLPLEYEFPEFSAKMCDLLKALKTEGKRIFQVEPFLEILMGVHDFFAAGHGPGKSEKILFSTPFTWRKKGPPAHCWLIIRRRLSRGFQ